MNKYRRVGHLYELEKYCESKGLDLNILTGKICQYCNKPTKKVTNVALYGVDKEYKGNSYQCKECDAHVGIHGGTDIGFGLVAKWELRSVRYHAHKYFDVIWREAMSIKQVTKSKARENSYKWLSYEMKKPFVLTHIGMMNIKECNQVIELCKPYYNRKYNDTT